MALRAGCPAAPGGLGGADRLAGQARLRGKHDGRIRCPTGVCSASGRQTTFACRCALAWRGEEPVHPFERQHLNASGDVSAHAAGGEGTRTGPPRWHAERGATLRDTLFIWASQEKCAIGQNGTWSVAWLTDVNYRIDAPLAFSGSFRDALDGVFRLYSAASVPLYAGISTAQCLLKVDDREVR